MRGETKAESKNDRQKKDKIAKTKKCNYLNKIKRRAKRHQERMKTFYL